jgi:hypothetical protein
MCKRDGWEIHGATHLGTAVARTPFPAKLMLPSKLRTNNMPPDDVPQDEIRVCPPVRRTTADSAAGATFPTFAWLPSLAPNWARLIWLMMLAGCVTIILMAWHLKPSPSGIGTHEQLGLAPCSFYLHTGLPCPTCGGTTAFVWVIHGHPWMGLKTQPFGALVALVCMALLGMSVVGIVTGGVPVVRLTWRSSFGLALAIVTLILGSWLYKIAVVAAAR